MGWNHTYEGICYIHVHNLSTYLSIHPSIIHPSIHLSHIQSETTIPQLIKWFLLKPITLEVWSPIFRSNFLDVPKGRLECLRFMHSTKRISTQGLSFISHCWSCIYTYAIIYIYSSYIHTHICICEYIYIYMYIYIYV